MGENCKSRQYRNFCNEFENSKFTLLLNCLQNLTTSHPYCDCLVQATLTFGLLHQLPQPISLLKAFSYCPHSSQSHPVKTQVKQTHFSAHSLSSHIIKGKRQTSSFTNKFLYNPTDDLSCLTVFSSFDQPLYCSSTMLNTLFPQGIGISYPIFLECYFSKYLNSPFPHHLYILI